MKEKDWDVFEVSKNRIPNKINETAKFYSYVGEKSVLQKINKKELIEFVYFISLSGVPDSFWDNFKIQICYEHSNKKRVLFSCGKIYDVDDGKIIDNVPNDFISYISVNNADFICDYHYDKENKKVILMNLCSDINIFNHVSEKIHNREKNDK